MDFVGTLKGVLRDFNGKVTISYEVDAITPEQADRLSKMGVTRISLKKHRPRRSLDANALLWACIGEIAATLQADKWEIYLEMLKRYGQYTYAVVKPKAVDKFREQWRESEIVGEINRNGQRGIQLLCYFGSSTYDSKEFSILLDGVISDMEELGLDKPLSSDIRRALDELNNKQ